MYKPIASPVKWFLALIALLGWFALSVQLYINLNSGIAPIPELLIRFFSYFTILTNLLVTVCCTSIVLSPGSRLGKFFSGQSTQAAITVYILIVGIIYNIVLRFLWNPQGWQRVVDEMLHSVIPVLFVAYWLLFAPKDRLQWKNILPWMVYPLLYIIYVSVRGITSGFYPYPFINSSVLGANKVLLNSIGITLLFLFISLAFVWVGKALARK